MSRLRLGPRPDDSVAVVGEPSSGRQRLNGYRLAGQKALDRIRLCAQVERADLEVAVEQQRVRAGVVDESAYPYAARGIDNAAALSPAVRLGAAEGGRSIRRDWAETVTGTSSGWNQSMGNT
jgi:hypothetical protein